MGIVLPTTIAHRGAPQLAPENTLLAMQKAADCGASWVECDCRLSADRNVVIIHDRTLRRTTNGRGHVDKLSLLQLQMLSASPDQNPAIKIPTLQQLLQLVYANNLGLNLEIKTPFRQVNTLCRELLQIIGQTPIRRDKFLISVSSLKSLAVLQRNIDADYGLVMRRWPRNWRKKLLNKGLYSVHFNYKALTAQRVKLLKDAGLQVLAYTVNDSALAEKLYAWGVASVFTDCLATS